MENSTLEKIYAKLESIKEKLQELTERLETRRISFNERQTQPSKHKISKDYE